MNALAKILSSQIRAGIFGILFGMKERPVHMREIERLSGFAIGTIQQELRKLKELDLVTRRRDGNRVYYEANVLHPLYPEIRSMVLKTVGLVGILRSALEESPDIRAAFIYGSIAKGEEKANARPPIYAAGRWLLAVGFAIFLGGVLTGSRNETPASVIALSGMVMYFVGGLIMAKFG